MYNWKSPAEFFTTFSYIIHGMHNYEIWVYLELCGTRFSNGWSTYRRKVAHSFIKIARFDFFLWMPMEDYFQCQRPKKANKHTVIFLFIYTALVSHFSKRNEPNGNTVDPRCKTKDDPSVLQPIFVLVTDVYHNLLSKYSTVVCQVRRINYLINL